MLRLPDRRDGACHSMSSTADMYSALLLRTADAGTAERERVGGPQRRPHGRIQLLRRAPAAAAAAAAAAAPLVADPAAAAATAVARVAAAIVAARQAPAAQAAAAGRAVAPAAARQALPAALGAAALAGVRADGCTLSVQSGLWRTN